MNTQQFGRASCRMFFHFALSCCLLGGSSLAARAQEPDEVETARHHYEAGVNYYEQLRYEDAAREFREAYRISGRSHLLKNVAISLQHARRWAEAADAYAQYLDETPGESDRDGILTRIARLRELAAGEARGDETQEERVPESLPLESEEGDSREASPANEVGPESSFPVVPTIFVSAAAAFGIGALATGIVAHDTYGRLEAACVGGVCDPSLRADRDQGEALAITSTVLTGAFVAAAATGIILFIVSGGESTDTEPSVTGYFDREGGGIVIRGRM